MTHSICTIFVLLCGIEFQLEGLTIKCLPFPEFKVLNSLINRMYVTSSKMDYNVLCTVTQM